MMTNFLKLFSFVTIFSILIFSCKKDEIRVDLDKGLVAYYPFNGDAKDQSKFKNNGTTYKATFEDDRFGNANKSILFENDSTSFFAEHRSHLNFQSEFSLALWVKKGGRWRTNYFIEKGASLIEKPNRSPFGLAYSGTGAAVFSTTSTIDELPTQARLEHAGVSGWTHFAGIFVNGSLKLYLNGELVDTDQLISPLLTNEEPLYLGSLPGQSISDDKYEVINAFSGNLDEVRIYDRALNEEEIFKLLDL